MPKNRVFAIKFASVYPLYVQKAERKGRTKAEVDRVVCWLTGYDEDGLKKQIRDGNDLETSFAEAPALHPNSALITGVVCGVRVEEVEDPLMRRIRWLDKLIDELARGWPLEKILRGSRSPGPELPKSMVTGKASPAKAAVGDEAVFAYIASLPQPQRGIAESVDALAAKTLPGLRRSVKWGIAFYGVGDGWCFCCGGFAGHVKLMFVNGTALVPVPPVTPVAMGRSTRGVELESVDDLDERQVAAWMRQVAAVPGVGRSKGSARRSR